MGVTAGATNAGEGCASGRKSPTQATFRAETFTDACFGHRCAAMVGAPCVPIVRLEGVLTDFTWLNEPRNWNVENGVLTLKTEANTDFWRTTFYGFRRHSGHARLQAVSGDFTASVVVRGDYRELYDQAGLMLIIDETHWLKTGIEFTDGLMHFSVVVTNGTSDWSVIPLAQAQPNAEVHIRLTRHEAALRVQFHLGDGPWQMARLCPFSGEDARIGVMACSPEREGFTAQFEGFCLGAPISRDLHAS